MTLVGIGLVWLTPENEYAPTTTDEGPFIVTTIFPVPVGFVRYQNSASLLKNDDVFFVSCVPPNVIDDTSLLFASTPTTRRRLLPVPALKLASVIDDDTVPDVDLILFRTIPFVVADAVLDGGLVPTELIADTLYVYVVLDCNPVSEYVVDVDPVFGKIIDHVEPESVDLSILYPVIGEPPLLLGTIHERLICDDDTAVAVRLVGADGAVRVADVVADAVLDGGLIPTELIADTLYVYVVLDCNPVSEYDVPVLPVFVTTTENAPPPMDLSISYPVIGEPPLSVGAFQLRLICDDDTAVAVRLVGLIGGPVELVTEKTSPPYILAGLDAIMKLFESYMLTLADNGKLYMPTSSVAVPSVTGELERTCPDVSTIFTVAAFDGLLLTMTF
jgi:hypothetical protein